MKLGYRSSFVSSRKKKSVFFYSVLIVLALLMLYINCIAETDPLAETVEGDFIISIIDGSLMVNIGDDTFVDVIPVRNYQVALCSKAGICQEPVSADISGSAVISKYEEKSYCSWAGKETVANAVMMKAYQYSGYDSLLFSQTDLGFRCSVSSSRVNSIDYRYPEKAELEALLQHVKSGRSYTSFSNLDQALTSGLYMKRLMDGMDEIYIPADTFIMGSDDSKAKVDEKILHQVSLAAYLIDKTEITNQQYASCVEAGICTEPTSKSAYGAYSYYGNPEYDEFPVVGITWQQAQSYCEWAGMRLPTEAEWEYAAKGKDSLIYPWGNDYSAEFVHDAASNVYVPERSGTREQDISPFGVMEMGGNVAEWVKDLYSDSWYSVSGNKNPQGPATGYYRVVRGGSYLYQSTYSRTTNRNYAAETVVSSDRGFRCAASIDQINFSKFALSDEIIDIQIPDYSEKIAASNSFLQATLKETNTDDSSESTESTEFSEKADVVRIPGGSFQMGYASGKADEKPVHTVTLSDFSMDRYEVTNEAYAACVEAGMCTEPKNHGSLRHNDYYDNTDYADFPVVYVTWSQAEAYCEYAGGHLPTEAEWEYAASGGTGNIYPWGNSFNASNLNYAGSGINDTAASGSIEGDVSPFGIKDMGGNVSEWVFDKYGDAWYSQSQNSTDPQGPEWGSYNSVRGASFQNAEYFARTSYRYYAKSESSSYDRGFRCAYTH